MKPLAPLLLALILGFALPAPARAQGCSMCLDTTAGSAPAMQAGLRRAIPVLGIPAAVLFVSMLAVAATTRPGRK